MNDRAADGQQQEPATAEEAVGLERLVFFSDAVFAIAITLLALDIRLPAGLDAASDQSLLRELLGLYSEYLAFAVSFLAIGLYWQGHHRRYTMLRRYDSRLIWLNLLLLMGIAFTPFPSSVLAEYGNRTATIFYALTMVVIGLLQLAMWRYASAGHRMLDATITNARIRHENRILLAAPAVFMLSIAIAFLNADAAKFSWLLLVPVTFVLRRAQDAE